MTPYFASLPSRRSLAKTVVKIYQTRMQIEEEFRNMKSRQYGLGFNQNKTTQLERMKVLVFLASFANVMLTIIGLIVYIKNEHGQYQANKIKNRRVLSFQTLGIRSILSKRFRAKLQHLKTAIDELKIYTNGFECCTC